MIQATIATQLSGCALAGGPSDGGADDVPSLRCIAAGALPSAGLLRGCNLGNLAFAGCGPSELFCDRPLSDRVMGRLDASECESICCRTPQWSYNPYCTVSHVQGSSPRQFTISCGGCSVDGRRTDGIRVDHESALDIGCDVARYFATMAAGEAGSVRAFERLVTELLALGAPMSLVSQVQVAAADEQRHTQAAGEFARTFGAEPLGFSDSISSATRSAFEIAVENAVVGCVEESFGALVATWQSTHATQFRGREFFSMIADDETRHAELAWQIAEFLESHLSEPERLIVLNASHHAMDSIERKVYLPSSELSAWVGAPSNDILHQLAQRFRTALLTRFWAPRTDSSN